MNAPRPRPDHVGGSEHIGRREIAEGLDVKPSPFTVAGVRIVCRHCGCSVSADHVPGDDVCQSLQDERAWKAATDV